MRHGFAALGLRKITGGTSAKNLGMVRIFEHWRMRLEGTLRAQELLDALVRAGIPLAMVTNKIEASANAQARAAGWGGQFDVIVGADSAGAPKPSALPSIHALRAMGVEAARAAFVGDTTRLDALDLGEPGLGEPAGAGDEGAGGVLLHARGALVTVSARSAPALQAFCAAHPGAQALPLDVTDAVAVQAAGRRLLAGGAGLDLVCCCAGTYRPMRATAFDLDVALQQTPDKVDPYETEIEAVLLAIGVALGGQVGVGTLIIALGTGPILGAVLPPLERRLHEPVHVETFPAP